MKTGWAILLSIALHASIIALPLTLPEHQPHHAHVMTLFLVSDPSPAVSHEDVDDVDNVPAPVPVPVPTSSSAPRPRATPNPPPAPEPEVADHPTQQIAHSTTAAVPSAEDVTAVAAVRPSAAPDPPQTILSSAPPEAPIDTTFGNMEGPRFVRKVVPTYPRRARRMGKEGVVVLRLTIDRNGQVVDIEPVEAEGREFQEAAVNAVKQSTFEPAKKDGKPVTCRALLPFRFSIAR